MFTKLTLTRFIVGAAAVLALTAQASAASANDVVLDEVATGFSAPVYVDAPTGDSRLFVVEQGGLIRIVENGVIRSQPFLDIRSLVRWSGEQGLLGLAFDPDYATNKRFYVHYSDSSGNTVVAEYRAGSDPNRADTATRRILLTVDQPAPNHNGGSIAFGADGYLYIALGDGGGGNDTYGNGQNTSTLLGSIVRIDADTGAAAPGNPFGKIWAYGLRNPWRMSFDSSTGDLYIGDVGQVTREEIDVVNKPGVNLGWPILEGNVCRPPASSCTTPPGYQAPIHDYSKDPGPRSVTGGYVYRGSDLPDLVGTYFYADVYDGRIRSFRNTGGSATNHTDWTNEFGTVPLIVSFGTDGSNELYVVSLRGSIYRFAPGALRISGQDRYATAAAVSEHAFASAKVAYVVTGDNWPDALVAGSRGDGPVLLTRPGSLPSVVRDELSRLGPLDDVFVVGGPAAVNNTVLQQLSPYATRVTRISGANRYATSAVFTKRFHTAGASVVYIATGENHPDALITAAAAGHEGAPLLLTRAGTLPLDTVKELQRLAPDEVIVVGGESAISPFVVDRIAQYTPLVTRVSGSDRYATSAAVSRMTYGTGGKVYTATGLEFPDALVGAAAAVSSGSSLLLVTDTSVPAPTAGELNRIAPNEIILLGGITAVDRQTQADLGGYIR
ncbi:MAG: hypothetical protein GWP18_00565 [Proteobacteria bacterium]|nr:hypothetical protein [Pseudomonadota bacterium]